MKFDCIIMNPPYQQNLHLKILAEALKYLKNDKSICVNLSPVGWLTDPVAKLKKNSKYNYFEETVSKHINSLDMLDAKVMSETFSIALWSGLGVYVCEKSSDNTLYESVAKNEKGKCWSLVEKIGIPLFTKTIPNVCSVFDAFSKNTSLPYWIKCSRVHGHTGCKDEFDCITPKIELVLNKKGHEGKEVYFSTKEEAINFFKTLNLRFFKFVKYLGCYSKHDFNKGLPFFGDAINPRTGLKGYQGEWLDKDLYRYFKLTDDEIKIIEETMEKYNY